MERRLPNENVTFNKVNDKVQIVPGIPKNLII